MEVIDDMLKVSIPENPIEDIIDDLPITLRKGKHVKYPISQFMCTNHLSIQHQSFIIVIDAIDYGIDYGIDYEEITPHITKMNAVQIILSIATHFVLDSLFRRLIKQESSNNFNFQKTFQLFPASIKCTGYYTNS
ncbi:hypothetical protein CR513_32494, partial [Mucuna pruriens]